MQIVFNLIGYADVQNTVFKSELIDVVLDSVSCTITTIVVYSPSAEQLDLRHVDSLPVQKSLAIDATTGIAFLTVLSEPLDSICPVCL